VACSGLVLGSGTPGTRKGASPRRRTPLLLAAALASWLCAQGEDTYRIQARVDEGGRSLEGRVLIGWTNRCRAPVEELRFHLYWNAFRDRDSSLMREAGGSFQRRWRAEDFGSTEVTSLHVVRGAVRTDLLGGMKMVSPDDQNIRDATVAAVPLPFQVAPSERITIQVVFRARAPKAHLRAGWVPGEGLYAMQWYPKLGVLQDRGDGVEWNCRQYHAQGEFFSEFATYDVELTLPERFVVGATGGKPREVQAQDGNRTWVFRQERVHDFAFVADPDFRVQERRIEVHGQEIEARLLLHPQHDTQRQQRRHLEALECGLRFYGERFGPYPYPAITLVDPGIDAFGEVYAAGMEYPTLITGGTELFPARRRLVPEDVVVHEFGHQYWYGMAANDEVAEAWLDEGINTYCEGRAQSLYYGGSLCPLRTTSFGVLTLAGVPMPLAAGGTLERWSRIPLPASWSATLPRFDGTWLPRSPLLAVLRTQPTAAYCREAAHQREGGDRAGMLGYDNPDPVVLPSFLFAGQTSYRVNSYQRPATVLRTLERFTGHEAWWRFLREFHEQSRFGHPTTADFVALLREHCGVDAAGLFERCTAPAAALDYGVESVTQSSSGAEVVVRRFGGIAAEVRVRFTFAGREPVWRTLSAGDAGPLWRFRFDRDQQGTALGDLLEVWVDPPGSARDGSAVEAAEGPAGVYLLDGNLLNNAWRRVPDSRPALYRSLRALQQVQNQLSFASWIG
jgi:hypothetical protein